MPQPDIIFIYIPCRDAAEAERIGKKVVEQKLAACANILPSIQSIYRWEREMQSSHETVLLLKTTQAMFKAVEAVVKGLHSYETPCIAALAVSDINDAYRAWLLNEIQPSC